MLILPTVGIAPCNEELEKHKIRLDVLCDWIEASVIFDDEKLSNTDVVDVLLEEGIYTRQDLVWHMVDTAWGELRTRGLWSGEGSLIKVENSRLSLKGTWQERPAQAFCLLLSLTQWYPGWELQFGKSYIAQGDLFERLTLESLKVHLPNWTVYRTGWTSAQPSRLDKVVAEIATLLHEEKRSVKRWNQTLSKEAGIDLLCFRSFDDERVGTAVYLTQCASGKDWIKKTHTPDISKWTDLIHFAVTPKRAFALPFALQSDQFWETCRIVQGPVLDRTRLLAGGQSNANWLPQALRDELVTWLQPRINVLPYRT